MSDRANVVTRRNLIQSAAMVGLGALLKGCVATPTSEGATTDDPSVVDSAGNPDCILTPSAVEGPFYVDLNLVRSNIRESQAGTELTLTLKVVRANSCAAIADAVVDIWHANAEGSYSGEASEGTADETFLRGVQTTDANGEARFTTIYPGWYPGRTVHVHAKIFVDGGVLTTQFYFSDALTDAVYAANAAYNTRGTRDTLNTEDGILADQDEGVGVFLRVNENGSGGYSGTLTIGVA